MRLFMVSLSFDISKEKYGRKYKGKEIRRDL